MTDNFKCTSCGFEISEDEAEFEVVEGKSITESSQLTCPVCQSKIELTAMLVEPGKKPEEVMSQEEPVPEEEAPEGEESAPEAEAPAGQEAAPEAPAGEGAPEQITAKESVDVAIDSLLNQPVKIHSMRGFRKSPLIREGKYIDTTPTPSEMRHLLTIIIKNSKSPADREWAKAELARIKDVTGWKSPREAGSELAYAMTRGAPKQPESSQDVHTKVGVVQDEPSLPMESLDEANMKWGSKVRLTQNIRDEKQNIVVPFDTIGRLVQSRFHKANGHEAEVKFPQGTFSVPVGDLKLAESLNESDRSLYELGSERSFKNEDDYVIYFASQYIEISKDDRIVTTFYPESDVDDVQETKNIQIGKKLQEEKEVKEWEGDFANFNSKIFSACKDLDLSPDKFEQVILNLQNAEAIELSKNKVCLVLEKARKVFIELLTGQVQSAEDQSQAVSDLHEPPQKAPDLGNAPSAVQPIESISEGEEKKDVESRVDMILKKYFV